MSDVVDVVVEPTAERTWAAMVLLEQEMSPSEVRAVLTTHDPKLVRRFIELHRERLEEGLLTQRRRLAAVERILTRDTERQAQEPIPSLLDASTCRRSSDRRGVAEEDVTKA